MVSREFRFSVGRETRSGRYFLSTPVSGWNRAIEYEVRFEIDAAEFDRFRADPASALEFVELCRNRGAQDRLFKK
ncbi:MAG: hypothetical protein GEU95_20945 [Rhizobiales bacterium]|nr:hypothetical protein [Hyphomicrobiales bacterium]